MSISLRPGQVADNPILEALYQEVLKDQPLLTLKESPQVSPENQEQIIYLALEDDQVLAYLIARPFSPRQAYRFTYQLQLIMKDSQWQESIAQALYQAVMDPLSQKDLQTLLVTLTNQQVSQIHFFQEQGFVIAGQLPHSYQDNQALEMVWLSKSLK